MASFNVPGNAIAKVAVDALYRDIFAGKTPWPEKFRVYYGKSDDDMGRIETIVRQADVGIMLPITDFGREAISMDPHVSMCALKRFGALQSLDYDLAPAKGPGIDDKLSLEICEMVRNHFRTMRGFRQSILDLAWGLFDGRALLEIDWQRTYGKHPNVPVRLSWVHPRMVAFGPRRQLVVINSFTSGVSWWYPNGFDVSAAPGKFIQFTPRRYGDYAEREGLLRRSVYWTYFKRFGMRKRMIFMELFAEPLRVITWKSEEGYAVNRESRDEATSAAESLGNETTADMVPGSDLKLHWPGENSGKIFADVNADSDAQNSKLWLGNTGTSDMKPDALGGGATAVHEGQQGIYRELDAADISARIQEDLVIVDVVLNYGPDLVSHAPTFTLRSKVQVDRKVEQDRLNAAIQVGVPVKVSQYSELTGIEVPDDDEKIIVLVPGGFGPPIAKVIDQAAERKARELEAKAAEEAAKIAAQEAARVAAEQKKAEEAKAAAAKQAPAGAPAPPAAPPPPAGAPPPKTPTPAPAPPPAARPGKPGAPPVVAAASRGPLPFGSPETIIEKATREGTKITGAWAQLLASAVQDGHTPQQAMTAIKVAANKLPTDPFEELLTHTILRGAMLGALDAEWEAKHGTPIGVPTFADRRLLDFAGEGVAAVGPGASPTFVTRPFTEAIDDFLGRKVLSKSAFEQLGAEAKRKSFTVAGLAKKDMLSAVHDEMVKTIAGGDSMRDFRSQLAERFESRGWTPLNDSHAELVFRNASQGAYARGRDVQMNQPEVLAARPFRQIFGVDDDRARDAHAAAHGVVLRADDPFWETAALPWGHSCRCRAVSRSQADLERLGLTVSEGSSLSGLPDKGWNAKKLAHDHGLLLTAEEDALARDVAEVFRSPWAITYEVSVPRYAVGARVQCADGSTGTVVTADVADLYDVTPDDETGGAGWHTAGEVMPMGGVSFHVGGRVDIRDGGAGTITRVLRTDVYGVLLDTEDTPRRLIGDDLGPGPALRTYGPVRVVIDRPEGTVEYGVDANGKPWSRTWHVDCGEVPGTDGGDGAPVDVFCGPDASALTAFWILQARPDPEQKLALGVETRAQALAIYGAHVPLSMYGGIYEQPIGDVPALLALDPALRIDAIRALDPEATVLALAGGPRLEDDPYKRNHIGKFDPGGADHAARVAKGKAERATARADELTRTAATLADQEQHARAADTHVVARRAHLTAADAHRLAAQKHHEIGDVAAFTAHANEAKRHDTAAHESFAQSETLGRLAAEAGQAEKRRRAATLEAERHALMPARINTTIDTATRPPMAHAGGG